MAYSAFDRSKLPNSNPMKLHHSEDCDQFRHRKGPDFDLELQNDSSHRGKCPIYVHTFPKAPNYTGDFRKTKQSVLEKLEESYWANWKPNGEAVRKAPEIEVIKSAPTRRRKVRPHPRPLDESKIETLIQNESKSLDTKITKCQEAQTENVPSPRCEEVITPEVVEDSNKFLKHTDSYILNVKKQGEEKEHFEQPKCIRLYRKSGKVSSTVRGGSYPLKSCLKTEGSVPRNLRLGRPGSPMIASSNYHNRHNRNHRK